MERKLKNVLKTLKMNEGLISTLMGAVVVFIMATMIFNYFKTFNKNGRITEEPAVNIDENQVLSDQLPTTYKVVKGDDLWHISEKFFSSGYNYVDIVKENKLKDANTIEVGMELKIPKVESRANTKVKTEGSTKTEKSVKVEVKSVKLSIEGEKYTTTKGDHLWSIAVRAYGDGYKWTTIYNANKTKIGKNPSQLFTGIELALPR